MIHSHSPSTVVVFRIGMYRCSTHSLTKVLCFLWRGDEASVYSQLQYRYNRSKVIDNSVINLYLSLNLRKVNTSNFRDEFKQMYILRQDCINIETQRRQYEGHNTLLGYYTDQAHRAKVSIRAKGCIVA